MPESSLRPIYWEDDVVAIIDQRLLPHKRVVLRCTEPQQVIRAIKTMAIRGAPAVGIAGAAALALGALTLKAADPQTFRRKFVRLCRQVKEARPTGNNLSWAVEKVYSVVVENPEADVFQLRRLIREKVEALMAEDVAANRAIGAWGRKIVPSGARILTYCNAGALATADYGTALGVVRAAFAEDSSIHVYTCETRPFLQGSRLTAYELMVEGIPSTLITDNAAGSLMHQKRIDVVVVGADRIAANGDTANKIGTYTMAVLAKANDIPFYVAAPRSTIDPALADGSSIPIEERDPREVTHWNGRAVAPKGMAALNPAFDVTPNRLITGIITEVGVLRRPFKRTIKKALEA
ncbi:S-methyl-5-thioribose-1-phosphate isomerase [Desulfoglaeba alkanexedens]|uniref:Methylthioribose-1-phosphate isomerase n=1 Tax=Desulfoglaeba alkanexedens ALDC TaxID=980445 RepID=A0A4P8L6Z4_9BACT|nr:S-methyl-5-thioribose-1-phosphate isomerase [Desulfoglaeba alkanexedens]QCQ22502.1 S-methyl-5-thioribose-1-phosphate isomerase [Desulfoglaeba alkanexedens ALDC]